MSTVLGKPDAGKALSVIGEYEGKLLVGSVARGYGDLENSDGNRAEKGEMVGQAWALQVLTSSLIIDGGM